MSYISIFPCKGRIALHILVFCLFAAFQARAQQKYLEVPIKLEVENGDMDGVIVKVKKNGNDAFTQSGAKNMRLKLDFNMKYTLIFTKDGYITKTIQFDTKASSERIDKGFEPYRIGVKLFLQNEENMVIYNQPVAQIKFDPNLDEFNYQTDYSKSILSGMNRSSQKEKTDSVKTIPPEPKSKAEAEETEKTASVEQKENAPAESRKERKERKAQEKQESSPKKVKEQDAMDQKNPVPPAGGEDRAKTIPVAEGKEEAKAIMPALAEEKKSIVKPADGSEQASKMRPDGGEERSKKMKGGSGEERDAKKDAASGTDHSSKKTGPSDGEDALRYSIKTSMAQDAAPVQLGFTESEKITREDIVEPNRIITRVKVVRNGVTTEYSRVDYKWGGLYFFKNNTMSISENLFRQWTGVSK